MQPVSWCTRYMKEYLLLSDELWAGPRPIDGRPSRLTEAELWL